MEPIKSVDLIGFKISVFPTHVEITERRGFGGFLAPKSTTIPLRSIASIDVARMTSTIKIKTIDGKEYKYAVGGWNAASQLRDAILQAMK